MDNVLNYIEENKGRFLEELFGLIRIPSVSAKLEHKADMYSAAQYWRQLLLDSGADIAEVYSTAGNPVVFGRKLVGPDKPTVLVYGHYDVMPAEPFEAWRTSPFEPVVKDGKIWARGSDDDKGQSFIHAKAFEYLVRSGELPCNVKFMIEGEEEVGSAHLGAFCVEHKEMLSADIILISDTSMISADVPSITTGLRGISYMQVEVTGPNRDLHSGIYGGAVANPAMVLAQMVASLKNERGEVTIPGFYDDVRVYSAAEREVLNKAPFDELRYKQSLDLAELSGEEGYTTIERTGIRPALDVNGIWGGYTAEGTKTIIPSKAFAKISMRLVPNQEHGKIADLFTRYFESIAPPSVKVRVDYLHGGDGYVSPIDMPAYVAASRAYEQTYGKRPIPVNSGGSIPIVSSFERILGVKSILMGFGLESDAIHSPNESFPLDNFYKGIETVVWFYRFFADGFVV